MSKKSKLIELDPTTVVRVESQDGQPARLTFFTEDRDYDIKAAALVEMLSVLDGDQEDSA